LPIFVEDWQATYGSPYLVLPEDYGLARVEIVEDGGELRFHDSKRTKAQGGTIAFVDGVRRGEASLYRHNAKTGALARGIAGSHASGAVLAGDGRPATFAHERVRRLVIWGSGLGSDQGELPPVPGGWSWEVRSIADSLPDAPLRELQTRMREEEGRLAEELAAAGHLVVVDGPLNFVRSRDLPVVGYVKTHHRALLSPDRHRRIPELEPGSRTSLFTLGDDRYSCYLRLTRSTALSGPWAGIVRIEIPQSAGLAKAVGTADQVALAVPRFAGVPHRDPRAPQNLQPVGALESHLRRLLGDSRLAVRAVRDAAALSLVTESP
jgi:hypothetical protein